MNKPMIVSKNSAKAILFSDDKVLLIKKQYDDGSIVYTLPGGTQEPGEQLIDTVVREVFEEVAAQIRVIKLRHVYEHQRQSSKTPDLIKHKVEFAFLCELTTPYSPQNGHAPDSHQTGVEWMPVDKLANLNLNPANLATIIPTASAFESTVYLNNV